MDNIDHYRSTINKSTNQQTAAVWGLCPGRGDSQQATQAHVPWSVDLLWRWLGDVPRTEVSTWWTEMYIIIIIVNTWNLEKMFVVCHWDPMWQLRTQLGSQPVHTQGWVRFVRFMRLLYPWAMPKHLRMFERCADHVQMPDCACLASSWIERSLFQTTLVLETKGHWSGSVFFLAPFMFISLFLIFLASFVKCRPSSLLNSFWLFLPEVVSTIWWAPSKAPCSCDTTSINNPWAIHCQEITLPSWSQKHEGLLQVCGGSPLTILDDDASVISDEPWPAGFSQAFKTMPVLPQHEKVLGQLSHDVSQVFLGKWRCHLVI